MQDRALIEEVLRGFAELAKRPGRPVEPLPESENDVRIAHAGVKIRATPFHDGERDVTAWAIDISGDEE